VVLLPKEDAMSVRGAGETIKNTVSAWDGVTAHAHRFGGTEFRLGSREIGHVHGDGLVDIPFPTKVRNEIVSAGEASPHHVLPDSGWVSFYIQKPDDVERAVGLLRRSYEIAVAQRTRAGAAKDSRPA
jgi:luciferase-like monooxygenase